jgi:adenylosuccinate synthase
MPGWQCSTKTARYFADLPPQAQDYVRRVEELVGVRIWLVSVGPGRDENILLS